MTEQVQEITESVAEHPEVEPKKPKDSIEIVELGNPSFVSYHPDFLALVRKFAEKVDFPTVTYESLHNYFCTVLQGVYDQKLRGIPDKTITYKFHGGFINGKLCGISLFYLLTNRMPHIQTIDWAYCYTSNPARPGKGDIRLAYQFALKVKEWQKIWKARHISFLATDDGLNRIAKRLFINSKPCGTYWIGTGVRDALLKRS